MGFALEYIIKDNEFWKNVIYSDEKTFSTSDQRELHCYRMKGERYKEDNVGKSKRNGRIDVGMWGWMWGYGVGEIYPIDGKFNGDQYLFILKKIMLRSVRMLNPHGHIYFLHDNSPIHKCKKVQEWLQRQNEIIVINWPALSPDLNPIEHLWARFTSKWNGRQIKTKDTLIKHIENEWEELRKNPDICERLAISMPKRLQEVIDNNGGLTHY